MPDTELPPDLPSEVDTGITPDSAPFPLCTPDHLTDLLLADYIEACGQQNPGLVARTIEAVSGEIVTMLGHRYPLPWHAVPDLVRYCASVVSAYRVVQAITSLVRTEASTENDWLPLQKQWKYCTDMLADMAAGKLKLPLPEAFTEREDASVAVIAPRPLFDLRRF